MREREEMWWTDATTVFFPRRILCGDFSLLNDRFSTSNSLQQTFNRGEFDMDMFIIGFELGEPIFQKGEVPLYRLYPIIQACV